MKKYVKYLGYVPFVLFSAFYIYALFGIGNVDFVPACVLLLCLMLSGAVLHMGKFWGAAIGELAACMLIGAGVKENGGFLNENGIIGLILLVFFLFVGIYSFKNGKNDEKAVNLKEAVALLLRLLLSLAAAFLSLYFAVVSGMYMFFEGIKEVIIYASMLVLPLLLFPMIWAKKRKRFLIIWIVFTVVCGAAIGTNYGIIEYNKSITVNTSPNIDVYKYLPFDENSEIVKIKSENLSLTENLPKIDGAAALFPVYSAFVNAVYPETTKLYDGTFNYNNTPEGYRLLAEKETDIFIGVYPSNEQKEYAEKNGTTFNYTPIGNEAFVFFVHKDNPVNNLTTEQIKGIYSGKITNWAEVGGKNEKIAAFQRNEGSGSQSMLKRFMGDTPIAEAPTELKNDLMAGIIEEVANYKSKSNSIGFSFRYYVEGIIKNPDIKILSVDGILPTAENVRDGSYAITTPIYAVTYEENTNENTKKLLNWILSPEGQFIINETGYVGVE